MDNKKIEEVVLSGKLKDVGYEADAIFDANGNLVGLSDSKSTRAKSFADLCKDTEKWGRPLSHSAH